MSEWDSRFSLLLEGRKIYLYFLQCLQTLGTQLNLSERNLTLPGGYFLTYRRKGKMAVLFFKKENNFFLQPFLFSKQKCFCFDRSIWLQEWQLGLVGSTSKTASLAHVGCLSRSDQKAEHGCSPLSPQGLPVHLKVKDSRTSILRDKKGKLPQPGPGSQHWKLSLPPCSFGPLV